MRLPAEIFQIVLEVPPINSRQERRRDCGMHGTCLPPEYFCEWRLARALPTCDATGGGRPGTTHRSRRRFSQRATGLPRNLTFTHAAEKGSAGDSRRSGLQRLTGASSQLNECLRGPATEAADPELMHVRSTTAPEIRYLLPRSGGCITTSAQLGHPTAGAPTLKPASCETRWRIDSRR